MGWDDSQTGEHRCGIQEGKNKWLALFSLINFIIASRHFLAFHLQEVDSPVSVLEVLLFFPKFHFELLLTTVFELLICTTTLLRLLISLMIVFDQNNKRNNL